MRIEAVGRKNLSLFSVGCRSCKSVAKSSECTNILHFEFSGLFFVCFFSIQNRFTCDVRFDFPWRVLELHVVQYFNNSFHLLSCMLLGRSFFVILPFRATARYDVSRGRPRVHAVLTEMESSVKLPWEVASSGEEEGIVRYSRSLQRPHYGNRGRKETKRNNIWLFTFKESPLRIRQKQLCRSFPSYDVSLHSFPPTLSRPRSFLTCLPMAARIAGL